MIGGNVAEHHHVWISGGNTLLRVGTEQRAAEARQQAQSLHPEKSYSCRNREYGGQFTDCLGQKQFNQLYFG